MTAGPPGRSGCAGSAWREPIAAARSAPGGLQRRAASASGPTTRGRLRERRCLLGIALSRPRRLRARDPPHRRQLRRLPDQRAGLRARATRRWARGRRCCPIATNDAFFHPVPPRPELACEVLVLGRAHPDRVEPVQALAAAFDTHVYGEGWEEHGMDEPRPDLRRRRARRAQLGADHRVFFLTGGGHALVKVGPLRLRRGRGPGGHRPLSRGRALPHLRQGDRRASTSTEDLLDKVRHYLDHPAEADADPAGRPGARAGDHTWRTGLAAGPRRPAVGAVIRTGSREAATATSACARSPPPTPTHSTAGGWSQARAPDVPQHRAGPLRGPPAFLDRYFEPGNTDRWFVIEAAGAPVGAIALYDFVPDRRGGRVGPVRDRARAPRPRRGPARPGAADATTPGQLGLRRLRCEVLAGNPPPTGSIAALGFAETGLRRSHDGRRFLHSVPATWRAQPDGAHPPVRPHLPHRRGAWREIRECLEKGWTGLGYKTVAFEEAWRALQRPAPRAFPELGDRRPASRLPAAARRRSGWADGDEVITTPLTFVSTNHAILYEGLRPVFADVDEHLCLDPASVARADHPADAGGLLRRAWAATPGATPQVRDLCRERGLQLVLDAAHMAGTRHRRPPRRVATPTSPSSPSRRSRTCPPPTPG